MQARLTTEPVPPRVSKIADLPLPVLGEGSTVDTPWTRVLSCAEEELMTFELACSHLEPDSECDVQWWQNKRATHPGKTAAPPLVK